MLIDLDSKEIIFDVKLGGESYKLSEPSVDQIRGMNKSLKAIKDGKSEHDEMDIMKHVVTRLGLPEDKAGALGVSKLTMLINSIVKEMSSEKK